MLLIVSTGDGYVDSPSPCNQFTVDRYLKNLLYLIISMDINLGVESELNYVRDCKHLIR